MILKSIQKLLNKTIPAPKYLKYDPWFGPAILSDPQMSLKEAFDHAVSDGQLLPEDDIAEPKDIHEKIYQMAISSGKTTIQLNPIGGGSEIFQEKKENQI
jgi:hypothetical protein